MTSLPPHSAPAISLPHGPAPRRRPGHGLGQRWAAALLGGLILVAGCATNRAAYEEVPPASELYAGGLETLKGRRWLGLIRIVDYDGAIEQFQAIIENYPASDFEPMAQLKIADAYFSDKRYDEALSYYQDFADLHPEHPKVPYSLLQAALCHYEQIESIDRDQDATHRATTALEVLLRQHPYAEETRRGEELMVDLRRRLALQMLEIADFYRKRTHWQSAASRYRRILDEYPGLGLDARALYRLGLCLEKMRRRDEALRLYHVVVENYAETRSARDARARIASTH